MPPSGTRLLSASWVCPIATPPFADGAVVVDDRDTVVALGPRSELRAQFSKAPEVRAEGMLLPGLVNAHGHLELAALADAVPGGDGFVAWASALAGRSVEISDEKKAEAALDAARAAQKAGTAAMADVGNGLAGVAAMAEADLAGVFFHELLGSRDARTGDALADALAEKKTFDKAHGWPERVRYVCAPHAAYSAGPDLLRRIFAEAARTEQPTSIHVAEDADEVALLKNGRGRWPEILEAMGVPVETRSPGMGPLAYLESLGAFAGSRPPLLVHMVHASDQDLSIARAHRATVVICARSNLYIGGLLPSVPQMAAQSIPLALGTDSRASSGSMSLWEEIATCAQRFPTLPAALWLTAATTGGANALGLSHFGSLLPGKRPGVLDVAVEDSQSPLEALVRNPAPRLHWMATA